MGWLNLFNNSVNKGTSYDVITVCRSVVTFKRL